MTRGVLLSFFSLRNKVDDDTFGEKNKVVDIQVGKSLAAAVGAWGWERVTEAGCYPHPPYPLQRL